jgi:hypothetical protein
MIEGFGSVYLTNGSGRPENIRIRIRNTALEGFYLKNIKCVPAPPELRDLNAKLMEDCVHEVVDNAKLRGEFRYRERFRIRPDP